MLLDLVELIRISAIVARDFSKGTTDKIRGTRFGAIRFCFLHLSLYAAHITAERAGQQSLIRHHRQIRMTKAQVLFHWSLLWNAISPAVRRYSRDKMWEAAQDGLYWHSQSLPILSPDKLLAEDRELAGKCLEIIEMLEHDSDGDGGGDNDGDKPDTSAEELPFLNELLAAIGLDPLAEESVFPDNLVAALGVFIPLEDVSKYPRLARIHVQERLGAIAISIVAGTNRDELGPLPDGWEYRTDSNKEYFYLDHNTRSRTANRPFLNEEMSSRSGDRHGYEVAMSRGTVGGGPAAEDGN